MGGAGKQRAVRLVRRLRGQEESKNAHLVALTGYGRREDREWQCRWPIIGDVRGLGGMQAIELVKSQETKTPATEETKKITQYCYEHGLITITAGTHSNVIRVLVPLVASDAQVDEGLSVLEAALAAVCNQKGAVAQFV